MLNTLFLYFSIILSDLLSLKKNNFDSEQRGVVAHTVFIQFGTDLKCKLFSLHLFLRTDAVVVK